ncbi:hypothetical protein SAMD00019534_113660 [Acytostelium subglobosum LB1]|uniref:hypothetical protein n=1 Tax=Acytostelium subglobosum LB1 TaxID=1410327 RepID=UPI000644CD5F|nr:hypothetical protein SAMD00019534_113660 [Acytostelium subglobosum LB1]GAM28190.1 hypothetical protein SAMD00019534_113660 [Acytostelium subglobosum LB1]|eukprot:XP_012748824.1 hypothetical protein SAMD00019534_113660 [Acytostelium subglobosum LB1]
MDNVDKMDLIIPTSTSTSSSRMSTAFHMVFRERLVMIIMRMIGDLYRTSFGIKDGQLIKGKQLVNRDILVDFIKYGANEWFIKSFNSVANLYPFNSQLISYAIIYTNTHILDKLVTNTNMTFAIDASLPDMLRNYLKKNGPRNLAGWNHCIGVLKENIGRSTLVIFNTSFGQNINKEIKLLTGEEKMVRRTKGERVDFSKFSKLKDYIMNDIKDVTMDKAFHWLDWVWSNVNTDPQLFESMIIWCGKSGLQSDLDLVLSHMPASKLPPEKVIITYFEATLNGHFDMARRLFTIFTNDLPLWGRLDLRKLICVMLRQGHLDQALFIILSIGLLRRLMAHPNIRCTFASVMARAILNGDKDCINFLELNQDQTFETDYCQALEAAARVGDVDTANMIMIYHPDDCMPLEQVDLDDSTLDDEDWHLPIAQARYQTDLWSRVDPAVGLEMARHIASGDIGGFDTKSMYNIMASTRRPQTKMTDEVVQAFVMSWLATRQPNIDKYIIKIVKNAGSQSHSLIKMMHTIFTEANHRLLFTRAIPQCAQRGDTQSIKFILDVAREASGNVPLNLNLNVLTDLKSIKISDVDVMTMLMDTGIIQNTQQYHPIIVGVLDHACSNGLVDMMTFIDQHQTDIRLVPSLQSIEYAVIANHLNVIVYLFGDQSSSTMWRAMSQHPTHVIRLLIQLRHTAFIDGHVKMITWITNRINQLNLELPAGHK